MGNQYAKWDDGPYQNPPRPPARPPVEVWRDLWTEKQRCDYDAGINAYLMAQNDPDWWQLLLDLKWVYHAAWAKLGAGDQGTWLDMWDCPWDVSPMAKHLPLPPEEPPHA